jgi:VanZ family protein
MGVIFIFSSDSSSAHHSSGLFGPLIRFFFPNISPEAFDQIHTFVRKCGHFSEYGLLGLLYNFALTFSAPHWSRAKVFRIALMLSAFYAGTDEFHQLFVPTRTAMVSDVLIDTLGAATALLLLHLFKPKNGI